MSDNEFREEVIQHWVHKAQESLEAARDELKADRLAFTVNRIYYACFYIVSACLIEKELKFQKHSGVRTALHKHFIKTGVISKELGEFYNEMFEARQRGDYIELVFFDKTQVQQWLRRAEEFVDTMKSLIYMLLQ